MTPQTAAEKAVSVVGCGFDLTNDIHFSACKAGPDGSRLIVLDEVRGAGDLVVPGGVVVHKVSGSIKCDKGERTRFRSDFLSFHQMSEHFNQELSLAGKIPSGLFNAMFEFRAGWQKDASATKGLAYDGWLVTLYSIELARSQVVLHNHIKQDVPSSWDPMALAEFIEKYGTHIITGVKMGGKDVINVKQQHESTLQGSEVQSLLKKHSDYCFSDDFNGSSTLNSNESSRKFKNKQLATWEHAPIVKPFRLPVTLKDDVVAIHIRRGGLDNNQSHNKWLSTISQAPSVISMSLVPITSLLTGVRGSGFLSHAMNLYLRYKPAIEELHQFLEFQLPRKWAPVFGELPLGLQWKKHGFPSLQFTLMGPKLFINTTPVESGNRPVTGIRLYLEGKRNDCLAIHLQHLSELPKILQLSDNNRCDPDAESLHTKAYYESVKWYLLSHVCTAPIQYSGGRIDESAAFIVTKAWLEVKDIGMRKVLFLRLGFSTVASARIRRSEWDGPASISRKSGSISSLISSKFSISETPPPKPTKVDLNSAVFPGGPPVPIRDTKMSNLVDTTEMMRGPEDLPGYWVVTGAKLCADGRKMSLKVKYSLLTLITEDEM